jgi:hypothetical protein
MLKGAAVAALVLVSACNVIGNHEGYEPAQPIEYSHALHAGEYKIPCLYCHYGAERSRHAGVPAASICMNCHSQVKKDAPAIQALARAVETGKPIEWVKVHRLPDFAYFHHGRHLRAGVQCQDCHGPVQTMVRVRQVGPMTMGWCLDCHRSLARRPAAASGLSPPTDCSGCHY